MSLLPYLKLVPRDQGELDDSVSPGTTILVYLFPNLKGQSRIQVIDALPRSKPKNGGMGATARASGASPYWAL